MKKNRLRWLFALLICMPCLIGCSRKSHGLNPKAPITLTMWHNFGGEMQQLMDNLIDEFNSTVGKEQGIIINVTAISSSSQLQENLNMIVNEEPGAPEMPDIATCYPKTAVLFQEKGLLANLDDYFTEEELSAYIPQFIEEGRFGDQGLYVFPFAKSTEILYLNQTLFDEFAAETGIAMECFATFEGIADAAIKYYEWTDAKTPEIPNDGKSFYSADSWLNLAQAGMIQLGTKLFEENTLNLQNETYHQIWQVLYQPSVVGGFALYDGYSSDLSKTGDLVCSTGSSAGILFYGDTITYADNTIREVTYSILPYPTFEGGSKTVIQRGNGLCVAKTDDTRQYAASVFLKWFTDAKQNIRFISSTGYLPVTKYAFENELPKLMGSLEDEKIKMMLTAVISMYEQYDFFVAPVFDTFDDLSKNYEASYLTIMSEARAQYLMQPEVSITTNMEEFLEKFSQLKELR